jgi:hypothetical protein
MTLQVRSNRLNEAPILPDNSGQAFKSMRTGNVTSCVPFHHVREKGKALLSGVREIRVASRLTFG